MDIEDDEVLLDADEVSWKGSPMVNIYRGLDKFDLQHFPAVSPSEDHAVLYNVPIISNGSPPKPRRNYNKWDANHVRLPSSHRSQYPVAKSDGTTTLECRWELVQNALLQPIATSRDLEKAILSYNTKYEKLWKFRSLHRLFENDLEEEESCAFFENILPKIIQLALQLPDLIPTAIPLLKQGCNRSISMTQQQVACLLANAFLCTFPRRNTQKKKSEYSVFPDINFNRLFQSHGQSTIEKIKCICNYFRRVCSKMPVGVCTFSRRYINPKDIPNWEKCSDVISEETIPFHITSRGTIEDQGKGLLQVDFANKFIGGGVLGSGCVQEEIRFVICTELIVSQLFTEALKPQEALFMIGCEQYNQYKGYASSFTFDGNHVDSTPRDSSGRRACHIVGIDALHFVQSAHQYREELMQRELNKAYVGYFNPLQTSAPGIASGNWGCGSFGGQADLKAVLQIMVCAATNRPLVYYTFGNKELRDKIFEMYTFLVSNQVRVHQLWSTLRKFRKQNLAPDRLYSFIYQDYYSLAEMTDEPSITSLLCCNTTTGNESVQGAEIKTNGDEKKLKNLLKDMDDVDDIEMKEELPAKIDEVDSESEPEPKKISLITVLDQSYYSKPPKACPSTSKAAKIVPEETFDLVKETRIQIEEEPTACQDSSQKQQLKEEAIKYDSDLGEFVENSPTKSSRKSNYTRKISDYFNKINK